MLFAIAACIAGALGAQGELLTNGSFEDGLNGWQSNNPAITMDAAERGGRSVARIRVEADQPVGFPYLYQDLPAEPGETFEARVEAIERDISDGLGGYMSIEFYNAAGERLGYTQTEPARSTDAWKPLRCRGEAPPETVSARICLLLHARGEVFYDNASLRRINASGIADPVSGPVTITVTEEVACDALIGFGFEDDGWFYNAENAEAGVDAEDAALREARITWMQPDFVRMFVWYKDWCPSGDWETFTLDSDNMLSHYRTLDLYERLGTQVNITGVEWSMPESYRDPEAFARAQGMLLSHLIRDKGYSCIRYWTLTNEPNGAFTGMGYSFDDFVRIHELVRAEFAQRGLDIQIVGSDDAQDFRWFERCLTTPAYYEVSDLFSSHRYFPFLDRDIVVPFFDDRFALLNQHTPRKPFIVGEFGFQDSRSSVNLNPIMRSYPYAVWTTSLAIDGLNRGTAGFSIWSVHEMLYPGGMRMEYALWDYKDLGWQVRPVYHAWAMFTRLTSRGDRSFACTSTHPEQAAATRVGDTLFWVNQTSAEAELIVEGATVSDVQVMSESTLDGDRECGETVQAEDNRFTAPAMSFGYAHIR